MLSQENFSDLSDSELIKIHVSDPNSEAFQYLIKRHYPIVERQTKLLLNSNTLHEDVIQSVFIIFYKKITSIPHETVAGWLFKTTRFVAFNANRLEMRRKNNESLFLSEKEVSTLENGHFFTEELEEVHLALNSVNDRHKSLFILRFIEGLSFKDISQRMNISENAAQLGAAKSLKKVKQSLSKRNSNFNLNIFAPMTLLSLTNKQLQAYSELATLANTSPSFVSNNAVLLTKNITRIALFKKVKLAVSAILMIGAASSFMSMILNGEQTPILHEVVSNLDEKSSSNQKNESKTILIESSLLVFDHKNLSPQTLKQINWLSHKNSTKVKTAIINLETYQNLQNINGLDILISPQLILGNKQSGSMRIDDNNTSYQLSITAEVSDDKGIHLKWEMTLSSDNQTTFTYKNNIKLARNEILLISEKEGSHRYHTVRANEIKENSKQDPQPNNHKGTEKINHEEKESPHEELIL